MTSNGPMTVGELSRRTGVPVKNLRHTDWGLIYTVGRSPTNYRLFDADALWCVELIGQLRGLGLTVAEIRELTGTDTPIGPRLAELLHRSRARLTPRIAELEQMFERPWFSYYRDQLRPLIQASRGGRMTTRTIWSGSTKTGWPRSMGIRQLG